MDSVASAGALSLELGFDDFRQTDKEDSSVLDLVDKRHGSRNRHVRAMIATHAVYGYGNQRDLDRFTTHEPRIACVVYALITPICP